MDSAAKRSEEGTVRSFLTASTFNFAASIFRRVFGLPAAVFGVPSVLALAALLVAVGAIPVAAQVQFFGSFQSYGQNGAAYAQGLVTDASGNLYVSGAHALVYMPVDANGNPTSNTNVSCSPGSGEVPGNGAVMGMAIDTTNHLLFRADLSGPDGVPDVEEIALIGGSPTNCNLSYIDHGSWHAPTSVAVDASSNLYVLDAGTGSGTTGTIYKLTPGGYSKSEVCSSTGLLNTTGLSIDSSGTFYVASSSDSSVSGFNSVPAPPSYNYGMESPGLALTTGVFKVTGSGGGACTLTQIDSDLTSPTATAADAAGNIWVADLGANTIYTLMPNGSGSYNQIPFQSISQIRTLTVNSAGKVYGFGYQDAGLDKAVVWTGGTPPHNLGTYPVGTPAPVATVTVDFTNAAVAGGFNVTTQGASAGDFRATTGGSCGAGPYSALQSCTVNVTFTPQAPGLRTGALVVIDEAGNVLGTNYFYGVGVAPSMAFQPGTFSTVVPYSSGLSGLVSPFGAALDEAGNLYVTNLTSNYLYQYANGSPTPIMLDSTLTGPLGIAVDGAGNLWVAEWVRNDVVLETLTSPSTYTKTIAFSGLNGPYDVAVDGSGNVYIAEYGSGDVLKETLNNGSYTPSTVVSSLRFPNGVAVDASGNVYVADTGNNQVLEETPSGSSYTQTTVANSGLSFPEGLAIDPNGNVYISDSGNSRIVEATPSGGSFTQSTILATGMNRPVGLALDAAGDLYIADENTAVIDELNVSTAPSFAFDSSFVNIESADSPRAATLFNYGNADLNISTISIPTGFASDATTCALNAEVLGANSTCRLSIDFVPTTATSYSTSVVLTDNTGNNFGSTQQIVVSGTGTLAIPPADSASIVVAVTPSSFMAGQAATITATVTDTTNSNHTPTGSVTFTDSVDGALPGGTSVTMIGGTATLPGISLTGTGLHTITATYSDGNGGADFQSSTGTGSATVNPSSNVGLATSSYPVTLTFTAAGTVNSVNTLTQGAQGLDFAEWAFGDNCSGIHSGGDTCTVNVIFTPAFAGPRYGAVVVEDSSSNVLASAFISGIGTAPQTAFGGGTAPATAIAPTANSVALSNPTGIAMDGAGDLFIADIRNSRVIEMPTGGGAAQAISPTVNGITLNNPAGIAVDGAGNLFIADVFNWRVVEVPAGGGAAVAIAPTVNGTPLNNPVDVAVDGAGNLFISDTWNNRVVEISASGAIAAIAPTVNGTSLSYPSGIAVDGAGDLFIADTLHNRVVEVPANGGPATAIAPTVNTTTLNYPSGIAVDGAGDLFIADTLNSRMVEVPGDGSAATAFATTVNGLTLVHPNGIVVDGAGDMFIADHGNSRVVELQRSQTPALSYLLTAVGVKSSDSPQSVTVENIGNATLTFNGLGVAADFPLDSSVPSVCTSTTSLPAGARCTLPIDFTPTTVGSKSENLTLTTSANLVAQNISLSGTANQGTPTVTWPTASAITYGQTLASSTLSGSSSSVDGTFAFTTPGTAPTAGIVSQSVTFSPSDSADYRAVIGTVDVTVSQAAATVTLGSLNQTYTGSPLVATATTTPAGLSVSFTYSDSSTAPTAAGSYAVVGTINDTNYTGSAPGTLTISKAAATVTLGSLNQTYSGSPLVVTATTTPSGLTVSFTYNGSSTVPTAAGSYAVVGTINDTNHAGSAPGTLTISKAAATVTLGSLNQTYTGSPLAATATTTPAGLSVSFTYSGSSTAPTAAGSYAVVGTINDTNRTGSASGTLDIGTAISAASVTSSANPAVYSNAVTLTITISSIAGTPTGQVTFLDGTTPLGLAALSSGVASLTTSALTAGVHSITAIYTTTGSFSGSISSALSLTVVDLSVGSTGGSGGSGASQTTTPGGSASYTVPIVPSAGTTFPSAITLTVTGLPSGATATLNAEGWTQQTPTSWTLPANQPLSNVSLVFQLPEQTAAVAPNNGPVSKFPFVALGILLLPLARKWRTAGKRMNRWLCIALVATGMAVVAGMTGCGGSSSKAQTYNVTVTVTAGTLTHSTQLTLTVD